MSQMNNYVLLVGIAGADVEIMEKDGRQIAIFSLATNSKYTNKNQEVIKETQWHRIVGYGWIAKRMKDNITKGSKVAIQGSIKYKKYTSKDGTERIATNIVVEEFLIIAPFSKTAPESNGASMEDSKQTQSDDDLPF